MKNIHVLPTEKPSNGYILGKCIKELSDVKIGQLVKTYYLMFNEEYFKPQNIYITSDVEDINENDYIITKDGRLVQVSYLLSKDVHSASKVVLTTDQDLIKDGVQAIDDDFLEWFIKNPSCEEVETKLVYDSEYHPELIGNTKEEWSYYEITIPKEEPKTNLERLPFPELVKEFAEYYKNIPLVEEAKQETLEEAAKRYATDMSGTYYEDLYNAFNNGAKWQQEQDKNNYSEEDMLLFAKFVYEDDGSCVDNNGNVKKETLEQFKKK